MCAKVIIMKRLAESVASRNHRQLDVVKPSKLKAKQSRVFQSIRRQNAVEPRQRGRQANLPRAASSIIYRAKPILSRNR